MSGIRDIAKGAGLKNDVVFDIFEEIFRRVRKGESVKIVGFGTFDKRSFPGRKHQSPVINDGEEFKYGRSYRIGFKCSEQAKKRLNKKRKKKAAKKKAAKKTTKKKTAKKGKKK